MSNALVTVATYNNPMEARILQGRLEAEGLEVRIADEETVSVAWHLSQAVGGVKVQVAPADEDRARALVAELGDSAEDEARRSDPGEIQEARATRALLAAFLGIILPPLQLYSLWLVLRLIAAGPPMPGKIKGQIFLALLLDVWLIAAVIIALRFFGFWFA